MHWALSFANGKRVFYAVFGFLLITSALSVQAQTLWQGTTFGMSVNDVLRVTPAARKVEPGKQDSLHDGARELLRLEGVEIVSQTFRVAFYFKEQKLSQVMLSPVPRLDSWHATSLLVDRLAEALRAKYGAELQGGESSSRSRSLTWMSGRTNISVTAMDVVGTPFLTLVYQIRVAEDADKL